MNRREVLVGGAAAFAIAGTKVLAQARRWSSEPSTRCQARAPKSASMPRWHLKRPRRSSTARLTSICLPLGAPALLV